MNFSTAHIIETASLVVLKKIGVRGRRATKTAETIARVNNRKPQTKK